jgi:predicted dehydrogenase
VTAPEVGIGIVGYGGMGRAHAYGYHVASQVRALPCRPRLRAISGRDAGAVERAAVAYGIDDWTTDWRALVARDDIDIVDVVTPPGTHGEIVAAAAEAGKAVICEKPLEVDWDAGVAAVDAVRAAGVANAIGFNYRRLPALSLLKRMVDDGAVGEPRLWRATWLSDEFCDPAIPFDWRFDRAVGGTTIADLGAHLIDLALWIVGDIADVTAQSETFVRARPDGNGSDRAVEVDDASSALVTFTSGARGSFEMARSCVRRPCDFVVEVNGSAGTLRFDYANLNELWYGDGDDDPSLYGMRRIRAEHESHPYAAQWWPIGQGVGYGSSFVNQAADLLAAWPGGMWDPDLATGLRVQAVCDAMERSAAERRWLAPRQIPTASAPGAVR